MSVKNDSHLSFKTTIYVLRHVLGSTQCFFGRLPKKMASTVGLILGEVLVTNKSQNTHSAALKFQYYILALTSGFFGLVASFPIIFRDYIQCQCPPENEWKDILETACLVGNMTSLMQVGKKTEVITHDTYQDIPLLFIWLMIVNLLPTLMWKHGFSCISSLVRDMGHYNALEVQARSSRLVKFYTRDFRSVSIAYLWYIASHLASLGVLVHQIELCNSMLHQVFWYQLQDLTRADNDSSRIKQVFAQVVTCTVSNVAPNGQEKTEVFLCILTMNKTFSVMFKALGIMYTFALVLNVASSLSAVLNLLPAFRRYAKNIVFV